MAATTATRIAIVQNFLRQTGGFLGTLTGGTTTTAIDTSADSPLTTLDSTNAWKGWWLYVNAGTHIGVERVVSSSTPSTQTLTVAAVTGSYDTTDVYELHRLMSRAQLNDLLNIALTEHCFRKVTTILTLVPDGDMETSGVSDWTAASVEALTKDTTAGNVWYGTQALKVVTTSADGYARTASINVTEGRTYNIRAWCRPASASNVSKIVIYDVTNSAAVTVSGTISVSGADGNDFVPLSGDFTTPAGCRAIQVRLQDETNTSTTYWDMVQLWDPTRDYIDAPSWMARENDLDWVWYGSDITDIRNLRPGAPVRKCSIELDPQAIRHNILWFSGEAKGYPMYVTGFKHYDSLSADSSTTSCDEQWVRAVLAFLVYDRLSESKGGSDSDRYKKERDKWYRRLMARPKPVRSYSPYGVLGF